MKTQRAHRRKLRFTSTKDAAPAVTVKVERAPQRPIKRRKRQPRPRHDSPAPTRHRDGLPAATWSNIQEQFAAAKSLGEITWSVLQLFKEHEDLQGSASNPVFPIFVPSSEIYKMKVPRKRRIYDVLHVLEGIGVIKRVRCGGETRRTKGGYFLYYGRAAVVQHLVEMKSNSAQVMGSYRLSRRSKRASVVEEDSALVRVFEDQAAREKWPCLVTMTVCFLSLLFQQDYQVGVGLPAISGRLVEAKKLIGALRPSSSTESLYSDVHRRLYDVVSVLESCNMLDTSLETSSESIDKGLRKYVRFNYDIFTDPSVLFAGPNSVEQWNGDTSSESLFGDMVASLCGLKSPNSDNLEHRLVSPPLAYWQSLHAGMTLDTSPVLSPVATRVSGATGNANSGSFSFDEGKEVYLQRDGSSYLPPRTPGRYRPDEQPPPRVQSFFSPLDRVPIAKNDWFDESLQKLGLYAALHDYLL
ncbi:hypothetical protein PHYPSEUDO_006339 [Phytophthora pseudosyringae]|uniref:E2F/DP family winged-helix DNA-binding domain-containing protein n=1 Tax=Phytophthora pseudosyringae TaxID=221518 RepID=A0A8T1VM90_9STRA|nr:hypothetical protein PHYPSEUDO_006339 [Phytophthora pseudosyringae]